MAIPFKSDKESLEKIESFSGNVFDLLPDDSDCFLFKDLFDALDTSSIEAKYSIIGQNAFHPMKLISILIYGYTHGVFSGRELEKNCNENLAFMYIANNNCPNYRVLLDFRKNNEEFFHECFKQTVELAIEMKLATLGHVCFDGSKLDANSSKHKAMNYKHLKEKEEVLCKEIEALIAKANSCDNEEDIAYKEKTGYELSEDIKFNEQRLATIQEAKAALEAREEELNPGQAIDDKKQISFADIDARIMGNGKNFKYSYNVQISVDSYSQIIVGQHLSQNANDKQEVKAGLESIQENTGQLPEQMSLDNGYLSGENLENLKESGIDAYVAMDRGEKSHKESLEESERTVVKADFEYDKEQDCFHCPGGQILVLVKQGKNERCVYQGDADVCANCQYHARCCRSEKGNARTVTTDSYEDIRQDMRKHMEQEDSKEIYKQRKIVVEPVFGQIKNGGFRGFSLRGKGKVAGELSLVCAAHNMKKMVKAMKTGLVRPLSVKMVAQGG